MKFIWIGIIAFLGILQITGFTRVFGWFDLPGIMKDVGRFSGLIWLVSALFMTVTGILYGLRVSLWWLAGVAAQLLSRFLGVFYWKDSRNPGVSPFTGMFLLFFLLTHLFGDDLRGLDKRVAGW